MKIKYYWAILAIAVLQSICSIPAMAQHFSVEGGNGMAYAYLEDYNSTQGINAVYVVYGKSDKTIHFEAPTNEAITWYTYDDVINPLPSTQDGNTSTIPLSQTECGYVAMHADRPYYLYVVDYNNFQLVLDDIAVDASSGGCDIVTLNIAGEGKEMNYYAFNNMLPYEIERNITITYNSLQWNEEALMYEELPQEVTLKQYSQSYPVTAPLCNTIFTVTGDIFLKAWDMSKEASSEEYETVAVEAVAKATQTYREAENEIDRQPTELGGSAPVEIEFNAYYTDAVTHHEWQFSSDANFSTITHRYNDELLRYIFREDSVVYVRLVVSSNNEQCIYECEPMRVTIGESLLEAPNAFSPGTIDGKNDEWRVAFKSLLEFRCWIFNKQGVQMYYSDDPGKGWDGKYGGRLASPGVYYYVIEAVGSEGKKYKLSGHINLMRSKKQKENNTNTDNEITQ